MIALYCFWILALSAWYPDRRSTPPWYVIRTSLTKRQNICERHGKFHTPQTHHEHPFWHHNRQCAQCKLSVVLEPKNATKKVIGELIPELSEGGCHPGRSASLCSASCAKAWLLRAERCWSEMVRKIKEWSCAITFWYVSLAYWSLFRPLVNSAKLHGDLCVGGSIKYPQHYSRAVLRYCSHVHHTMVWMVCIIGFNPHSADLKPDSVAEHLEDELSK